MLLPLTHDTKAKTAKGKIKENNVKESMSFSGIKCTLTFAWRKLA